MTRNLTPMVRVLDAISNNDNQFEPLDFLIGRMEKVLRKEDYLSMLTPNQSARLLKTFAQASHHLVQDMPILDSLTKSLQKNIDTLRENDVISILKAFHYIGRDVRFSQRLLQDLNSTVVATAIENKDQVSMSFLLNYLHQFFLITQRSGQNANRELSKEQHIQMVQLL